MKTKVQILILLLAINSLKGQTSLNFSATNYSVGAGAAPRSIAIGDFNNDGKKDLAVANIFAQNIYILIGNGMGGFSAGTAISLDINQAFFIITDDFDADGKLDLAVTLTNNDKIAIIKGNGNGTFSSSIDYTTIPFPQEIVCSDFNGDGKKDLAVAASDASLANGEVYLLMGAAGGGFSTPIQFPTSNDPYSIIAGDLNGDSKKDLAVSSITSASNAIVFLMGDGQGNLGSATPYAGAKETFCFTSGDFNLDNKLDLVAANGNSDNLALMTGNGTGNYSTANLISTGTGSNPYWVITTDLNSDGKPDLISANYAAKNISVLLGNGSGNFGAVTNFTVGNAPFFVGSSDFNGDGKPDLVTANYFSDDVTVLINTTSVGVEGIDNSNLNISISPNPVSDYLNIYLGSPLNKAIVRLTDITGKVILERVNLTGDSFDLDLSAQKAGMYFIQVYNNSGELIKTSKVLKSNN